MDSTVRRLIGRLDERLGQMSGQLDELHASVRRVVVVAEADPEVSPDEGLAGLREDPPPGLGALHPKRADRKPAAGGGAAAAPKKGDGYLPRSAVPPTRPRPSRSSTASGPTSTTTDRPGRRGAGPQPLISVLEWYFEQDWAVARPEGADPLRRPAETDARPSPRRRGESACPWPMASPPRSSAWSRRSSVLAVRGGGGETKATPAPKAGPRRSPSHRARHDQTGRPGPPGRWTVASPTRSLEDRIGPSDENDHRFRFRKDDVDAHFSQTGPPDLGTTTVGGSSWSTPRWSHRPRRGKADLLREQAGPGEIRGIFEFQGIGGSAINSGPTSAAAWPGQPTFNYLPPAAETGPQRVVFPLILQAGGRAGPSAVPTQPAGAGESPPSAAAPGAEGPGRARLGPAASPGPPRRLRRGHQGNTGNGSPPSHEEGGREGRDRG